MLVGARGVQGLAGAFISPAALSILLATFPEGRERTQALDAWAALTGIGAATGLLAGGALVEALDWRSSRDSRRPSGSRRSLTPR